MKMVVKLRFSVHILKDMHYFPCLNRIVPQRLATHSEYEYENVRNTIYTGHKFSSQLFYNTAESGV